MVQKCGRHVTLLLSPTNSAYQGRATLKMLAAMAAFSAQAAREILGKFDMDQKNFEAILKRRQKGGGGKNKGAEEEVMEVEDGGEEEEKDLRTYLIYFMLAFFVSGNAQGRTNDVQSLLLDSVEWQLSSTFPFF